MDYRQHAERQAGAFGTARSRTGVRQTFALAGGTLTFKPVEQSLDPRSLAQIEVLPRRIH